MSERDLLAAPREQQRALGATVVAFDMAGYALAVGLTPRGRPYAFIPAEREEVGVEGAFVSEVVVALQDESQCFFATSHVGGADTLAVLLAACPEFQTVGSASPSYEMLADKAARAW